MAWTAAGTLAGVGPHAIAVDPAQQVFGGGELGRRPAGLCRFWRARLPQPAAQESEHQDQGDCGTHYTSPVRLPATCRSQKMNRGWRICARGNSP